MKVTVGAAMAAIALMCASASAQHPAQSEKPVTQAVLPPNAARLSHGRFHNFMVYSPAQPARSFVLFLSAESGWNADTERLAQQLVQQGAMVAGLDLPRVAAEFNADDSQCVFPDGDLENLSHFVQAYYHNPTYLAPMLVGISAGASLAFASLAQAPRDTFAGALTVNFCPVASLDKTLCKGSGLEYQAHVAGAIENPSAPRLFKPPKSLGNPWVSLQGGSAGTCPASQGSEFIAAVRGAAQLKLPNLSEKGPITAFGAPLTAAFNSLATEDRSRRNPARRPPTPLRS